jgi:recombination protein RecA
VAAASQSAWLKREIEARLALRMPGALSPPAQQTPRLMACGVARIDVLLGGGIPIGGITECTGATSSGRTSLAFSLLAQATGDAACAYVDVEDSVDPRSAAAAGVHLGNLLWVRLAGAEARAGRSEIRRPAPVVLPIRSVKPRGHGCGGHHPRSETRGLGSALETMLAQKAEARLAKMEGTPGYPNRPLSRQANLTQTNYTETSLAAVPASHVAYEQCNARTAEERDPRRQADRRAAEEARQRGQAIVRPSPAEPTKPQAPWTRLDKAIRAADQILQSGGFRVVVLDLASVPAEQALRIPAATWFRFRRAAEVSDAILLVLTQVACARSSALCVLDCAADTANASHNLLSGLVRTAEVARQRHSSPSAKKSPRRAASWEAAPHWMRAAGG